LVLSDSSVANGVKGGVGKSEGGGMTVFVQVGIVGVMFGVLAPFGLTKTGVKATNEEVEKGGEEFVVLVRRRLPGN
jgi:hypothetical protein